MHRKSSKTTRGARKFKVFIWNILHPCGDYVVIINAGKIVMSGNKMEKREIFSHTGFPGGQKRISPAQMLSKEETSVVKHAIKGMLPKNKLGRAILKNCHIYAGTQHEQEAQKPQTLNLNDLK